MKTKEELAIEFVKYINKYFLSCFQKKMDIIFKYSRKKKNTEKK